jgi:hypothetical protein
MPVQCGSWFVLESRVEVSATLPIASLATVTKAASSVRMRPLLIVNIVLFRVLTECLICLLRVCPNPGNPPCSS